MQTSEANLIVGFLENLKKLNFKEDWYVDHVEDRLCKKALSNASKKNIGNIGTPDLFYINKSENLVIIAEHKKSLTNHGDNYIDEKVKMVNSKEYFEKPIDSGVAINAVDGVLHYMSYLKENTPYKIIGLALSGNIDEKGKHKINTFAVYPKTKKIEDKNIYTLQSEKDYIQLFLNFDKEKTILKIKQTAKLINNNMRDIQTGERPILLAGLVIALFYNDNIPKQTLKSRLDNDEVLTYEDIKRNLPLDIEEVLEKSGISGKTKVTTVKNAVKSIIDSKTLEKNDILSIIINDVNSIMSIITEYHEYDIMADFYQEFLRYANGDGSDLGIVLTPHHVTEFMVDLIEIFKGGISPTDIILDPCAGSGTFLTTFMNKQISLYAKNDNQMKNTIKQNNLIGVEINETMFILAIANMLVRGDGKSQLHFRDFFEKNIPLTSDGRLPTIGLMNPPYSQSKKDKGNNKSEMEFIERFLAKLDNNSFAGVITSKSTFFKTSSVYKLPKENIYLNHTLKAVINMPEDLFEPSASTHTSIAIFQTGIPHNENDEVYFYDLKYDGYRLLKNNRIDLFGKWEKIKEETLKDIKEKKVIKGVSSIVKNLNKDDEWIPEAWVETDFSEIIDNGEEEFLKTLKDYALFKFKEKSGILDNELKLKNEYEESKKEKIREKIPTGLTLLELLQEEKINAYDLISLDEGDFNETE